MVETTETKLLCFFFFKQVTLFTVNGALLPIAELGAAKMRPYKYARLQNLHKLHDFEMKLHFLP